MNTLEQIYPTQRARKFADEAIDKLPTHYSMNEYVRVWEYVYLDNGGIVRFSGKR